MSQEVIRLQRVSMTYGARIIFQQAEGSFLYGHVYGIVGRNGAGKSTLLRLIQGQESPDAGNIEIAPWVQFGYIPQEDVFYSEETTEEFLSRWTGKPQWEIAKQAYRFQLTHLLSTPVLSLSGGYRMRIKLLGMIISEPNVVLLDEPTNYLDLSTILLLENWILSFSGTVLLVTHDREFLARVSTVTAEVDRGKVYLFSGNIQEYKEKKQQHITRIQETNKQIQAKQDQLQQFVDRFKATPTKARQAKSKEKEIARLEQEKHPISREQAQVRMYIPQVMSKIGPALQVDGLTIGYPSVYLARKIHLSLDRGQKVALLGDNGQGKSTFLKTLAGILPPVQGKYTWNKTLSIGYFGQHIEDLPSQMNVYDYLSQYIEGDVTDQKVKDTLGSFLFSPEQWETRLHTLSGGEKSRLYLARLFLEGHDVLLLDEPTNHLDIETSDIMAQSLQEFKGTIIFISHDRAFIHILADTVWHIHNGHLDKYPGTYEEYLASLERALPEKSLSVSSSPSQSSSEKFQDQDGRKDLQRQIYQTRKEVQKIEDKITELEDDVRLGSLEAQQELFRQENLWTKVMHHLDHLEEEWENS